MRVVWLSCHLPYPPISGGRLREYELIRRLAPHVNIHVIAVSKSPDDQHHVESFRDLCRVDLFPVEPDARAACRAEGAHASRRASAAVAEALMTADLVHVEGFYLAQHVPPTDVPIFLVDQNIEFQLWEQRLKTMDGDHGRLERQRVQQETARCRRAEIEAWRRADLCATVTADDALALHETAPGVEVIVVPDGADHLRTPAPTAPSSERNRCASRITFVANFAYAPNHDAALYLLDEIVPLVRAVLPNVQVDLVGNEPGPDLLARAGPGVCVTGRVPDVRPYLLSSDVVLCPLRIGGGVKVKVLEALGAGAAVVTTPVGAQGLPTDLGALEIVPIDAARLAEATIRVLADADHRQSLQLAARRVAQTLPTWDEATIALLADYDQAQRLASTAFSA
jgi:glycosyltransferase involved in cell wall biosynthesis